MCCAAGSRSTRGCRHFADPFPQPRKLLMAKNIRNKSTLAQQAELDAAAAELEASLTTHEAASDPHTGYVKESDSNYVDLTDAGNTTLHTHDIYALDTDLTTHAGAADPHTGYAKETDATWLTVRQAEEVPTGAPTGTELPIAADTTASTGGLYIWTGAAWVKLSTIP